MAEHSEPGEPGTSRLTHRVPDDIFRQVYDSPRALPGKERWLTRDDDVREIERLLGMPDRSIGAPLWVSGDVRRCPKCARETNWLDIVSSALARVHQPRRIVEVILGEQKFVNVEAPHAIADLRCYSCGAELLGIRSFKCHNWAYAHGDLAEIVQHLEPREA
jgi:hypothetical protein